MRYFGLFKQEIKEKCFFTLLKSKCQFIDRVYLNISKLQIGEGCYKYLF